MRYETKTHNFKRIFWFIRNVKGTFHIIETLTANCTIAFWFTLEKKLHWNFVLLGFYDSLLLFHASLTFSRKGETSQWKYESGLKYLTIPTEAISHWYIKFIIRPLFEKLCKYETICANRILNRVYIRLINVLITNRLCVSLQQNLNDEFVTVCVHHRGDIVSSIMFNPVGCLRI